MKRSDAEAVILYVVNMLTTVARNSLDNVDPDTISAFARQFIEGCLQNDQLPEGGNGEFTREQINAYINRTNRPMDVYALHAKYAGRDMNSILYELEQCKDELALRDFEKRRQSPVDIDAERFRWVMRNLGDRKAMAAVMENPMQLAEQGSLAVAGAELKVLIDGVRFRS